MTWPDSLKLFNTSYWTEFLKKQFQLNKDIEALDHNKDWIHPSGFKMIFLDGVWVVIDLTLKL